MAEEALAKARAIAARLSGGMGGATDLGKRKNRWDEDVSGAGLGALKKKKIYIPVREHPDVNFLGLLIGPRGSTQKNLQEMSGAKIIIRGRGSQKDGAMATGHPDDDDELHVSIEGTDEAIDKAMKEVQQILYNPEQAMRLKQEQLSKLASMNGGSIGDSIYGPAKSDTEGYQVELRVPNNMVGLVIGKGGENIHRMQSQTGAHMQIAKESDMKPGETLRSIILKGSPDGVAELKRLVEDVISSRATTSSSAQAVSKGPMMKELDHAFVVKLPVPNDKVGIIIGKGGMTIKSIQERTRATIQIPPGPDDDNPEVRTLSIGADTKEATEEAHMEIYLALQMQQQQAAQQALAAPSNAVYIPVPDDKVGLIIGKGGVTIKDIQNRCHVKIQIPPSADANTFPPIRTCSIIGTPEAQHMARYEIEMVVTGQINTSQYGSSQPQQYGSWGSQSTYGSTTYGAAAYSAPYGQSAYSMPYAGGYDATYGAQYSAYGAQYPGATAVAAPTQSGAADASAAAAVDPNDPTAYYNDYWQYAVYYGEAAARVFYGQWSPPEGTPPPEGIVPLAPGTALPVGAAADAGVSGDSVPAGEGSAVATSEGDAGAAAVSTAEGGGGGGDAAPEDPEAAAVAWEAYKKQYSEWYEAHGKAAGADPNPPQL